jgi:hypothetical protein
MLRVEEALLEVFGFDEERLNLDAEVSHLAALRFRLGRRVEHRAKELGALVATHGVNAAKHSVEGAAGHAATRERTRLAHVDDACGLLGAAHANKPGANVTAFEKENALPLLRGSLARGAGTALCSSPLHGRSE